MPSDPSRKRYRRLLIFSLAILFSIFIILFIFIDNFVVSVLRDRFHTLIIQGSDSLYTYKLGKLKANFFGGNVEVENLQINIDSNRYEYLKQRNSLPSLTMNLSLDKGYIKGVGLFSLFFGKKIKVREIMSKDADIKISRHIIKNSISQKRPPVWKAIQPKIESIYIGKIKLNGIRLLYKNSDTTESVKLKFDRCDALFNDIRIDSAASVDTTRIGFTKTISLKFNDLKFRTEDSLYKMKAKEISYSSEERILQVDSFKLQATVEKDEFYKMIGHQESIYYIEFNKVRFVNARLDHFIYNNIIDADSIVFESPDIDIYNDRSYPLNYKSRIGNYPHQKLLKASSTIIVNSIIVKKGQVIYTEKNPVTSKEGVFSLKNMDMVANNITNDSLRIKQNPVLSAQVSGLTLGNSPLVTRFSFYLDSSNGRYDANGNIRNVSFDQLNGLAVPLANVQLNSLNLNYLEFKVKGQDYSASGMVRMLYNNLSLTLRKTDQETGQTKNRKFVTKILNKFVIRPDNPGTDGIERIAANRIVSRLTTEAFFGLLWKTIFAGMQEIMMRVGHN